MKTPAQKLKKIIELESTKIKPSFPFPSYWAIQNIVRRLDVLTLFLNKSDKYTEDQISEMRGYFEYGWAPALKPFYMDIDLNTLIPFPLMNSDLISWTDSVVILSGKLALCKQLLDYEKAEMIDLITPKKNEFTYKFRNKYTGIEQYDHMSKDFFRNEIIEKMIENTKLNSPFNKDEIKLKLRQIIKNPDGKLISYDTTPEIDDYYNQQGHFHILRNQGYDEFSNNDIFGNIEYWKYVDLIEIITGVALMHTDACLELLKMNNKVDLHNVLSYTYSKANTLKIYSNYLGCSNEEVEQMFSCFTLNKENYDYYLEYPGTPPPMYFQVTNDLLIRSVAGCLGNPFDILNRELKRKYRSDYDKAVNNREKRFRDELFLFFPQDRIIKVPKSINLSFNGVKTDIDAILFDTVTKTLGLFQLKWQDKFSNSMIERFSRMSNLFPKANEWISKINMWIGNNSSKEILNALQITIPSSQSSEINNICIFVLSRNQMNFTGMVIDESAAWGSWHQMIESQAKIETKFDDPIKELFAKLKLFSPSNRIKLQELPKIPDIDVRFSNYRIYYNNQR